MPALNLLKRWFSSFPLQPHPNPRLQVSWSLIQLSVLLLPFSTLLGVAGTLVAVSVVWKWYYRRFLAQPLHWAFVVLGALIVVSVVLAHSPADAAIGALHFLPFFLGFAGLTELLQTPAQVRRLVWLLVLSSIGVSFVGLGQLGFGWLGYRQVFNLQILWLVIDWSIDPIGTPPGRMSSVFAYANSLAGYLVVTFVLSLGLWVEALAAKRNWRQFWLMATLLLNAIALILTHSRNAWAISTAACLLFALYLGWRWLTVGVSALVGVVLSAAYAPPPLQTWLRAIVPAFFWARLTDQLYPDRPLPTLRATQWKFALSLTEQRPWFGWGLRNFRPLYQAHTGFVLGHPHNLPLMLTCETGIPATVLLVGLIGWIVARGACALIGAIESNFYRSNWSDRLLLFTVLVAFGGDAIFNLFDITLFDVRLNLMAWLLLAGIWGTTGRGEGARRKAEG